MNKPIYVVNVSPQQAERLEQQQKTIDEGMLDLKKSQAMTEAEILAEAKSQVASEIQHKNDAKRMAELAKRTYSNS